MIENALVDLGGQNKAALKRLAILATDHIKSGEPTPISPFCEWVADRLTGISKQDFSILMGGKKGSGKSYSSLYLATRIAESLARRVGGKPEDYFNLQNCALLEDSENISRILNDAGKQQVIIIDDASTAVGSRDFQSSGNKNFNKLLTTCRTRRWCLILNVPVRTHVDLQIRELVDCTASVYKSFHAAGFNVLKIMSNDVQATVKGNKTYARRLSFSDRKIDFWIAQSPSPVLAAKYDLLRDEAAQRLISDSVAASDKKNAPKVSASERNLKNLVSRFGNAITLDLKNGITMNEIAGKHGLTNFNVRRIIRFMGIPLPQKGGVTS